MATLSPLALVESSVASLLQQLQEAGFRECPPPPGFYGTMYRRKLAQGFTYVVLPTYPNELVEAFVGDWLLPRRRFHGLSTSLRQLLYLLSEPAASSANYTQTRLRISRPSLRISL